MSGKECSFLDDDVFGDGGGTPFYKAEAKFSDLIQIMSKPFSVSQHYTKKGGYIRCKGEGNNCPLCAKGEKAKPTFGVMIVHIGRRKAGSEKGWKAVKDEEDNKGKIMKWTFGGDKFILIQTAIKDHASSEDITVKEAYKECMQASWKIACADEKFQKLIMNTMAGGKKVLTKDMLERLKPHKDDIKDFFDREEKGDDSDTAEYEGDDDAFGDDDLAEDEEEDKPKKDKKKNKKKDKEEVEDDDVLDDGEDEKEEPPDDDDEDVDLEDFLEDDD